MRSNMVKENKIFTIVILAIFISMFTVHSSYGNSAEPPSILIIVPNAPDDLEISVGTGDAFTEARETNKLIETHYTFYSREIRMVSDYTFTISTGNINYEIALEKPLKLYNNIYTLDLDAQTLTPGKLLSRSILLVSMRIILTLIIEGILFWQFGFRNKESWIAFLMINLVTQGALNIWINGFPPAQSYLVFSLIFAEIIIVIVEILSFLILVKEHSGPRKVSYALVANVLSLIAGGYIITMLPI
ncbi:hypothetical protein SAMN05446037_102641 [Anaerovirgula multivorans]|uniref:Uncharacterized protein n=1 Tax=Anaerovirgula multivorans TaxID=312168 RepID=A0A239IAI3_9FIRM|nr:hypothetical protein [Anaerovirgula multivorans]SNS90073.1 hypothetical protein SAMN05446037_102641 [Anaerovirgula multivorans]